MKMRSGGRSRGRVPHDRLIDRTYVISLNSIADVKFGSSVLLPEIGPSAALGAAARMDRRTSQFIGGRSILDQKIHKIVLSGLFVALGLIVPFAAGHAFGIKGTIFLPMHIPVLLCGMICGPRYGMLCGLLTPTLSSMLTGMPATFPMLPVLICELLVYGTVSGWLYRIRRASPYRTLLFSVVPGRIVNGTVLAILLSLNSGKLVFALAAQSVLTGLPGVAVQFLLVPPLVKYFEVRSFG